jgi:thiol-disulfide isomerase/thioredoxin
MKKEFMLGIFVVGILFVYGCSQSAVTETANNADEDSGLIQTGSVTGLASNYYRFDKEHYERSMSDGKVIFLDFHADWCPICNREQPHIFAAFNELNNDNVVGYQVHFKDKKTTADDEEMAKKYGITLQHTKIVIDEGGNVVSRSLEGFSKEKVFEEINKAVGS